LFQLERTFIAIKPDGVQRGLVQSIKRIIFYAHRFVFSRFVPILPFSFLQTHPLVQISEIVGRFERKGYKLVAIKLIVPTKEFAAQHYDDLSSRPFFNGLCDFLSSGPVVAMVTLHMNLPQFTPLLHLFYVTSCNITSLEYA
jgi:nucleoside-diphosphate kinase